MVDGKLYSATVPLLYLVIVELSAICRETDILEILRNDLNIGKYTFPGVDNSMILLRRVAVIHMVNTGLFIVVFFMVFQLFEVDFTIAATLWILTWIMWIFLPYLEIQEYGQMPPDLQAYEAQGGGETNSDLLHSSVKTHIKYIAVLPVLLFLLNYISSRGASSMFVSSVSAGWIWSSGLWLTVLYMSFENITKFTRAVVGEATAYNVYKQKQKED
ncbi:hypothetical protein HZS55_07735 [Halosimplex rubrum]|uniref:Uncharacterized protein n=1 Tax=Halosimplex rubrum TaxID=869889 RepID=A0A7D5SX93_9EURY|nr:hypothetical protein [Halosimplex rubrum]QLH77191.1 hypothetical protein HZS55_07735 [Halosimplex rubrum]